jgi:hypothetical protein
LAWALIARRHEAYPGRDYAEPAPKGPERSEGRPWPLREPRPAGPPEWSAGVNAAQMTAVERSVLKSEMSPTERAWTDKAMEVMIGPVAPSMAERATRWRLAQIFIQTWMFEATRAGVSPSQMLDLQDGMLWRLAPNERIVGFEKGSVVTDGPDGMRAFAFQKQGSIKQLRPRVAQRLIASLRDRQLKALELVR